ncbi:hypothetical protein DB347_22400 [Opitutaceae bacterium EW11]|nr:hypothetical protein DB347_22400 [Opitutaceae bacterium EW11]
MTLTPEQKQAVSDWVAAGANISEVQKKLLEQFKISMTYMDVRFLVDDLNLALKDPTPKPDANDVSKAPPARAAGEKPAEKKGFLDRAKEKLGLGKEEEDVGAGELDEELPGDELAEDAEAFPEGEALGASNVTVAVDKVTLHPGALASGSVTFSDGVTAKWLVDNYGRPGFTEVSKPGYRPSQADAQAFMQELSLALQNRGY